jgi:hypothetical protein
MWRAYNYNSNLNLKARTIVSGTKVEVELQGLCGFNVNFAQVVWSSPRGLVESRFCNWSSFLISRLNSKNLESVFHMMKLNEVMLDRFRCRFQPSIWSGPKPRLGCWIDELTGHGEAVKNAAKSLIACKLRPFIFVLWKYLKFKLFFKINIFLIFLNFFDVLMIKIIFKK